MKVNRREFFAWTIAAAFASKVKESAAAVVDGMLRPIRHRGWLRANWPWLDGYMNRKESESEYGQYFAKLAEDSSKHYRTFPPGPDLFTGRLGSGDIAKAGFDDWKRKKDEAV